MYLFVQYFLMSCKCCDLMFPDKCMEILYEEGNTLLQAQEWLKSSLQLHMANAALIVANMARSGKHYWY